MGERVWVVSRRDGILPFVLAKELANLQDRPEDEVGPW